MDSANQIQLEELNKSPPLTYEEAQKEEEYLKNNPPASYQESFEHLTIGEQPTMRNIVTEIEEKPDITNSIGCCDVCHKFIYAGEEHMIVYANDENGNDHFSLYMRPQICVPCTKRVRRFHYDLSPEQNMIRIPRHLGFLQSLREKIRPEYDIQYSYTTVDEPYSYCYLSKIVCTILCGLIILRTDSYLQTLDIISELPPWKRNILKCLGISAPV